MTKTSKVSQLADELVQALRDKLLLNSRLKRLRQCLEDVRLDLETLHKGNPRNAEAIKGAIKYIDDALETDVNLHERFGEG